MRPLKGYGEMVKRGRSRSGRAHGIGLLGEELFKVECLERGFNVHDMRLNEPCDFLVNGKLVEVKSSSVNSIHGKWTFDFTKNKGYFEYLVCAADAGVSVRWFIIPASELAEHTALAFNDRGRKHWLQFEDRWDLLGISR